MHSSPPGSIDQRHASLFMSAPTRIQPGFGFEYAIDRSLSAGSLYDRFWPKAARRRRLVHRVTSGFVTASKIGRLAISLVTRSAVGAPSKPRNEQRATETAIILKSSLLKG
jgi:hypothetical protein